MEEPHVWSYNKEENSVVFYENDFEVFLNPPGDGIDYYEFEVNPFNTTWQLSLDRPYNQGGIATSPCMIPGIVSAVSIDGTLNDPTDVDVGWSVEIAIPFSGLARFSGGLCLFNPKACLVHH
jgi:hypothetical protein